MGYLWLGRAAAWCARAGGSQTGQSNHLEVTGLRVKYQILCRSGCWCHKYIEPSHGIYWTQPRIRGAWSRQARAIETVFQWGHWGDESAPLWTNQVECSQVPEGDPGIRRVYSSTRLSRIYFWRTKGIEQWWSRLRRRFRPQQLRFWLQWSTKNAQTEVWS